ncbi:MAG: hypothetical protein KF846_13680 [Cyclobacteriaceae bacterium]|nr:hypothetical protein [Cyclobacteriaceae bacterium]MBX2957208.1 hypothetical protein [Cyclobacteriaceae bacterium]
MQFKDFKRITSSLNSLNIEWVENARDTGTFTVTGKSKKKASGTFIFSTEGLQLNLTSSDYSNGYIKRLVMTELGSVSNNVHVVMLINIPQAGSTISTRQYIDQLQPGQSVNLAMGTYYYSVDSDVVDCNGWPLRSNFNAIFQQQVERRCNRNTQALTYTLFTLS